MRISSEADEQKTVIEVCELLRIPVVHIPNEGKRSERYGAELRRMGLQKGFPDLFFPAARKGFHGLFIELKRDGKSRTTQEQTAWIEYLTQAGYRATVCHGAPKAISEIRLYFDR